MMGNRNSRILAAWMTVVMIVTMAFPAFAGSSAGMSETGRVPMERRLTRMENLSRIWDEERWDGDIPDEDILDEDILDEDILDEDILDEDAVDQAYFSVDGRHVGFATGSDDEVQVNCRIGSDSNADKISFYLRRDYRTNEVQIPDPVSVTLELATGSDLGPVTAEVSAPLQELVKVEINGNNRLRVGKPVVFDVSFIGQDRGDWMKCIINDLDKNYIQISGGISGRVPVVYGVDGEFQFYSAEDARYWKGPMFDAGGTAYTVVGEVNLNSTSVPSFTLYHKVLTWPARSEENPEDVYIASARMNPDGIFTFEDGSLELENPPMSGQGVIKLPVRMKTEAFQEWKQEAEGEQKKINAMYFLEDLLLEYSDGYFASGKDGGLPILYHLTYIPSETGESGGTESGGTESGGTESGGTESGGTESGGTESGGTESGGTESGGTESGGTEAGGTESGGSGSDSSETSSSTATLVMPGMTVRETESTAEDIGWIQKDGVWYYKDALGRIVTDWLLGPDGRWYFLNQNGVMKTGWLQLGSTWYFFNADGAMATGWVYHTDGKWYYLNLNGAMAANMVTPDGYFVDKDGAWVPHIY